MVCSTMHQSTSQMAGQYSLGKHHGEQQVDGHEKTCQPAPNATTFQDTNLQALREYDLAVNDIIATQELAESYDERGQYREAAKHFYLAWQADNKIKDGGTILGARAAEGLARAYCEQRNLPQADRWYTYARESYARSLGNHDPGYLRCRAEEIRVSDSLNEQRTGERANL